MKIQLKDSGLFRPYSIGPENGSTYGTTTVKAVLENAKKFRQQIAALK